MAAWAKFVKVSVDVKMWHGKIFVKMTTLSADTNNYKPKHQNANINY